MKSKEHFNENIKVFVWYGILFQIMERLYKPYAVKFLERIGGSNFHISLFNALPGFTMFLTVFIGALWLNRQEDGKRAIQKTIFVSRFLILAFAAVPFIRPELQPMVFIVLYAVMSAPMAVYLSGYQGFVGDVFDKNKRARAIGLSNQYGVYAVMVVTMVTGLILSKLPRTESERMLIYQLFFILSFAAGILELFVFGRLKAPKTTRREIPDWKRSFRGIFRNRPFAFFMICSLLFHFGWQMGWPLFSIYMIKDLGADELWLAIINMGSFITMIAGHKIWPRYIEKIGNPTVTAICTIGMAFTPLLYIVSKNLVVMTMVAVLTGFFTSGTLTVLLSGLLEVIPEDERIVYMGFYNTFINLSLAFAPMLGHYFMQSRSIVFALYMTALFRLIGGIAFIYRSWHIKADGKRGRRAA